MEIDPHTIQQILLRIRQQMRCPQCGKRVSVELGNVRIVSDSAMLLQLKCETCNAFIVLHASLHGVEKLSAPAYDTDGTANASSTLRMSDDEVKMLREALHQSGGSFEKMFKKYGVPTDGAIKDNGRNTDIA